MSSSASLSGMTVLDLTELLPGPYATQHLVEMGADIIKVERPGGDSAPTMFPGLFQSINRFKKVSFLILKTIRTAPPLSNLPKLPMC